MGCQIEIAEKIIEKGVDYLLAVKQNQKTLYEDIESAFLVYENQCSQQRKLMAQK